MDDRRQPRLVLVALTLLLLMLAACGSDADPVVDSDDTSADVDSASGDDSSTNDGSIGDAPASGQASASVDGLDLEFELPGALSCSISDESLTYSYRIGDNEITLGGGLNRADDGWIGSISLTIANPDGEQGPIAYYPAPGENGILDGSLITIDGSSVEYDGPMLKQPANDGSQPPPVDVGTGRIVATC